MRRSCLDAEARRDAAQRETSACATAEESRRQAVDELEARSRDAGELRQLLRAALRDKQRVEAQLDAAKAHELKLSAALRDLSLIHI